MRLLIVFLVLIGLATQTAAAQEEACPAAVQAVLAEAASVCSGVEASQGCLAHAPAEVVPLGEVPLVFADPGDEISLESLYSLHLGGLVPDTGEWGVAMLRVPTDAAGRDAVLVLSGDADLRNSCSALMQQEVHIMLETEFRSGPGSNYPSLGMLPVGTTVLVNACNCTGNWLRAIGPDEQVGWVWSGSINELNDPDALPVVRRDTPVYGPMQAFCFRSALTEPPCVGAPENGLLIQAPPGTEPAHLRINQIDLGLSSTVFIQSQPGYTFNLEVLDGLASVTLDEFTLNAPRGVRVVVPLTADNTPAGPAILEWIEPADVAAVPIALLPIPVDVSASVPDPMPIIAGVEPCHVAPDQGPAPCRVHFLNADADPIQSLEAAFVDAPVGEWSDSAHTSPVVLEGDPTAGVLAWDAICSIGSANFIGSVTWQLTLVDAQGHRSAPVEASFNCG